MEDGRFSLNEYTLTHTTGGLWWRGPAEPPRCLLHSNSLKNDEALNNLQIRCGELERGGKLTDSPTLGAFQLAVNRVGDHPPRPPPGNSVLQEPANP